jgi:hypothetical protein
MKTHKSKSSVPASIEPPALTSWAYGRTISRGRDIAKLLEGALAELVLIRRSLQGIRDALHPESDPAPSTPHEFMPHLKWQVWQDPPCCYVCGELQGHACHVGADG